MKRTSIEDSASPQSPSAFRLPDRESNKTTRVGKLGKLLLADGIKPDQYPTHGRVRAYLTDEDHTHDPRDEPDLIDWCVSVGATTLLRDGLLQWHRNSVTLQNTGVAQVLALGVTAALDADAKHIAVVRCIPDPRLNDAHKQDLVMGLVRAACECDALTLEDFRLLNSEEMRQFLDFACGHCSLTQLALSRVSGMDIDAMRQLAQLVTTSGVLSLCLGEVDPGVLVDFLATLLQMSEGGFMCLKRLDISYAVAGDTEGYMTAKARQQSDDIDLQVELLKSRHDGLEVNARRILVMPDERPTGSEPDRQEQDHSFCGLTSRIELSAPGTPPEREVVLNPSRDVLECFDTDMPPEPRRPPRGIEWSPRVLRRPGFLADIGQGLGVRWLAEESLPDRILWLRLQTLETLAPRMASVLTDGEPAKLKWIREINRDHRDLWDATYARHLEALVREDTQVIERMEALLMEGKTFELIRLVQRLRARDQLPAPERITALLTRHDENPALRTVALWAFKPIQAIDELVEEGKIEQLHMWANTLRRVDALPPSEALQPLFDRHADRGDVMQALFCFLP